MVVVVWGKVIIVSALSLSLRDKDRLRDRESLTKRKASEKCMCQMILPYNLKFQDQKGKGATFCGFFSLPTLIYLVWWNK